MNTEELINKLNSIKKMIVDKKYEDAIKLIEKIEMTISINEDPVSDYINNLIKDLN